MLRSVWRQLSRPLAIGAIILLIALIPPLKDRTIMLLSPVVMVVRHTGERVVNSVHLVTTIRHLARENGELQSQINELSGVRIENQELRHENELLRKELHVTSPEAADRLIAAQVISRSSSVSQPSLVINKGSNDGFHDGMAVIAQGYLVGTVTATLPHSCTITLITSGSSLLPIVLQSSRSVGLLKGGAEGLTINEIPRDVALQPNEAVVTAHLGDVIASGIPVGTVASVLSGKSDVFQSARITSPIDFSRLEVVFGVK